MKPVAEEFAQMVAVDRASRTLVHWLEIAVHLADARSAMRRLPDFEDPHIVSWGRVRRGEAEQLVAQEQDPEIRQELLEEITGIFASEDVLVTLFYSEASRGQ
ncbi:hypothetical protein WMF04_15245 [Sorangium sp. So ce260]|uniref:hypothetical protein n=1 Tax=Sorangium sp. So ce260 TaxID=3133291 RepID=UPI003F638501